MAFTLPDLPYDHDALAAKGMSAETLEYHHDLHHNAYVTNGNKAIEGTQWESKSLEDIIKGTYEPSAVAQSGIFNNISQLWNHNQFWEMMTPKDSKMPSELESALNVSFGSVDKFKETFAAAGAGQFGSGWAWLALSDGKLEVFARPNQDSPLMFGHTPILGLDVWEHAYYLNYQNRRAAYIEAYWNVIDWGFVQQLYEEAVG